MMNDEQFEEFVDDDFIEQLESKDGPPELVKDISVAPLKIFTVETIMKQIGGFGFFQFVALCIFSLIRNYGLYVIYLFGMSTESQEYECRPILSPDD